MSKVEIEKLIYKKPSLNSFLNPLYGTYNSVDIMEFGGETGGGDGDEVIDDGNGTEGAGSNIPNP